MARLVLTDASPLIALARIDALDWLRALFGTVWMPPEVHAEVLPGRGLADEAAIAAAAAGRSNRPADRPNSALTHNQFPINTKGAQ